MIRNKDGSKDIWLLAAFYLATRVVLMLCSETRATYGEILYIGTVAQGILQGWAVPFWDFQHSSYSGGILANGLLSVPLFALIGPKVIALYVLGLAISLGGLFILFFLCRSYYGRRAAVFAALLYIFSPPLVMGCSIIPSTKDSVLGLAMFFLFLNLMRDRSWSGYLFLGLVSGFALWYSYINLVAVCGYMVLWFLRDRKFFLEKRYWIYWAGMVAGFAPWFLYNASNGYTGLGLLLDKGVSRSSILVNFRELVSSGWVKMFLFDQFSPFMGSWFNLAYYWIFLLSAGYLVWCKLRVKESREWEVLIFPAAFVALYVFSDEKFGNSGWGLFDYRYAQVIFLFVLLTVAIAAARGWKDRVLPVRITAALVFAVAVFMGIVGNRGFIVSIDLHNRYLGLPGYYYDLAGEVAFRRHGFDLSGAKRVINRIPSENGRSEAYMGYGRMLGVSEGLTRLEQAYKIGENIAAVPERRLFYWGLGEGLINYYYSSGYEKRLNILYRAISPWPREARVYTGCGMLALIFHYTASDIDVPAVLSAFPSEYHRLALFLYGHGEGINYFLRPLTVDLRQDIGGLVKYFENSSYVDDLQTGFVSGVAECFHGDMKKTARYCRGFAIPEEALFIAEKLYRFDPKTAGYDPAAGEAMVHLTGYGGVDAAEE